MTPHEIVRATLAAITPTGLDYVLVGAFATGYYAFPRATKDADFVVAAPLRAISEIAARFPPTFHVDPQPQMEMLTGTYRWIIRVDGTEFRVEIFHLAETRTTRRSSTDTWPWRRPSLGARYGFRPPRIW